MAILNIFAGWSDNDNENNAIPVDKLYPFLEAENYFTYERIDGNYNGKITSPEDNIIIYVRSI
jgi:hypothetical protein